MPQSQTADIVPSSRRKKNAKRRRKSAAPNARSARPASAFPALLIPPEQQQSIRENMCGAGKSRKADSATQVRE